MEKIYKPDYYVILKIQEKYKDVLYKLFSTWVGGYLGNDQWRINSGIESIQLQDNQYIFYGMSSSIYKCNKDTYNTSNYTKSVLDNILENINSMKNITVEVLDKDIDFMKLINKDG